MKRFTPSAHVLGLALAFSLVCAALPLHAQEPAEEPVAKPEVQDEAAAPVFQFNGHFATVGHIRSDSDFDPSERFYDLDGQTEGQVATYFRPRLGVSAGGFELTYEAELGWNVWSRNTHGLNNDFFSYGDGLALRHRQLWAAYRFTEEEALRVGYQWLRDPSHLFIDHYTGALSVDLGWLGVQTTLWLAQLPDSTLEGLSSQGDNFSTDAFAFGLDNAWSCGGLRVDVGLFGLYDMRVIDQTLGLVTALAGVSYEAQGLHVEGHLLGQFGQWTGSGVGGADQDIMAMAAQARVRQAIAAFDWSVGVLMLSGDDAEQGNGTLTAFIGSGKNKSPTTWLTEDEDRDRYDNLDELIASSWGSFFINRAGLLLVDASIGYAPSTWYSPRLVAAVGLTLSPDNALGERFVGAEVGLHNRFELGDYVTLIANLQALVPGGAVAAFVNDVDRRATSPAFGAKLGFLATF